MGGARWAVSGSKESGQLMGSEYFTLIASVLPRGAGEVGSELLFGRDLLFGGFRLRDHVDQREEEDQAATKEKGRRGRAVRGEIIKHIHVVDLESVLELLRDERETVGEQVGGPLVGWAI